MGNAARLADQGYWSFDDVQAALVEAMALWRRSPGGGAWPFAGDAPWHLMQRADRAGDWDKRGLDGKSSDVPLKPLPLGRDEVKRRDGVSEWLSWIECDADRRLVILAITALAKGRARVPWLALRRPMGVRLGADALAKRYRKALAGIAEKLNTAEILR